MANKCGLSISPCLTPLDIEKLLETWEAHFIDTLLCLYIENMYLIIIVQIFLFIKIGRITHISLFTV